MSRLRFTAALVLTLASGAACAETAGEKPGFLSSLLGLKSAQPAAPMAITVDPAQQSRLRADAAPKAAKTSGSDKPRIAAKHEPKITARPSIDPKAPQSTAEPVASSTAPDAKIDPAPNHTPRKVANGPFRGGGSQPVCVRTCDGFFFPVNYEGAHSDDRYAEACQSSCPAAKTEVYFMPRGADLKSAATARGERYTALPAAFKYRKERDATCSCKADSQTWGEVLTQADTLIRQDKRDILVTPEKSAELARPVDPNAPKPEVVAPQPKKSAARSKKLKPTTTQAAAPAVPAPQLRSAFTREAAKTDTSGAWKNSKTFVKVDREPTASISRGAQ